MQNPITGTYLSSNQTDTIAYYLYQPDSKPKGILQISHGMCEGMWRYEDFAQFLTAQGFLVCGNDHLGHGKSVQSQENLGYFADKDGACCLYRDVHKLTVIMKKDYPDIPYFLLGHSMGSFIARAYLAHFGSELDGAIIMGTSGPNPFAKLGIRLTKTIAKRKGEYYRSPFLYRMAFSAYNKRFQPQRTMHDWLSRDPSVANRFEADPYCNFIFTSSGFGDLFRLLHWVSGIDWAGQLPHDLPVLLTSGSDDPVGNYGKGVQTVYQWLRKAGIKDVSLQLYPQARHEILNETNRQEVYQDIFAWLKQRTVPPQAERTYHEHHN